MKSLILILTLSGLVACSGQPSAVQKDTEPEVLIVHADGTMEFNNRLISEKDVVIYPDGYGGERAAVLVRVPIKIRSDYYRDTIHVHRISDEDTLN